MMTTIWVGLIQSDLEILQRRDRSDLRLLAGGSSSVALKVRDWGVVVFRFALGLLVIYFFFSFFIKPLVISNVDL